MHASHFWKVFSNFTETSFSPRPLWLQMGTTMIRWTKVTSFGLQIFCLNLLESFISLLCSVARTLNFKFILAMKQVKTKYVHSWSTEKKGYAKRKWFCFPLGFITFPNTFLLVKSTFNTKQKLVFRSLKWNHVTKANHCQWERPSKN